MKFLSKLLLIILLLPLMTGCNEINLEDTPWSGEHQLRKMTEHTRSSYSAGGGFFLLAGGYSSHQTTDIYITFAWDYAKRVYILSSLPLNQVRIKINNNITTPTVKFTFERPTIPGNRDINDACWIIDHWVKYATITVREEDWPVDIHLPLNKEE